jgi:F-type H+-transporting ATPase subunit epsilon
MGHFKIDILSPSQVVAQSIEADSVEIPTVKGQITVLPEHTHVVSNLDLGVLQLSSGDGESYYLLDGGVCKVLGEKITILSSSCSRSSEIDFGQAEENLKECRSKLSDMKELSVEEIDQWLRKERQSELQLSMRNYK